MIVIYSKLVGLPVFEIKTQKKLGQVKELVFNKSNFAINGILIRASSFLSKENAISASDIVEVSSQAILVNDEDALMNLNDSIRLKNAVKEGQYGIGQQVVTKSGNKIGRVIDLYISTDAMTVIKFLVKGLLSERIIFAHTIVEIKKRKIVIKDDFEAIKSASPATEGCLI